MSPQQGDSDRTIRLRLPDGRWTIFRLAPEMWQHYYGGARRGVASEREERAELGKLLALQPGPVGPRREPKTKQDGEAATRIYRQGAHLYVGMEEARQAAAEEPDKLKVELDAVEKAIKADPAVLGDAGTDALQAAARIAVVEDALRRYHPDFDGKSRGERIELLMHGARRMDEAWRALDAFAEFVQGGRTGGRAKRKAPDPQLDLRAAELRDALYLTQREIGEVLGVPRYESEESIHDGNRRVGRAIDRGRKLFDDNLGKDGYTAHIDRVRDDLRRRHALGGQEGLVLRLMELAAGLTGRSAEDAEALRPAFERLVEKRFSTD